MGSANQRVKHIGAGVRNWSVGIPARNPGPVRRAGLKPCATSERIWQPPTLQMAASSSNLISRSRSRSIRRTVCGECTLAAVLSKTRFWQALKAVPINERQRLVLNRLLDGFEGKLTTSKWAKIVKCSSDTALRDILDLVERAFFCATRKEAAAPVTLSPRFRSRWPNTYRSDGGSVRFWRSKCRATLGTRCRMQVE